MVRVIFKDSFKKKIEKIKDSFLKDKIKKQIDKIVENPQIGKPMRYDRKDTRELYAKPFRISYHYNKNELIILFLDIYHKNKQ